MTICEFCVHVLNNGWQLGSLDRPLNLAKKGIFNHVPMVFGSNKNDGACIGWQFNYDVIWSHAGSIFVPLGELIIPQIPPLTQQCAR